MAKIVLAQKDVATVLLSDVQLSKTYAYTTPNGGVWILSKLGRYTSQGASERSKINQGKYYYAFVRVDTIQEVPVFATERDYDTIEKAIKSGRKVLEFDTFTDFMKWKLKIE